MAPLKIDLYANDGSPLKITPETIYTRGVGGAELSMMTWAQTMTERGHQIRVYNDPDRPGEYDGVPYLPQRAFRPDEERDVFIVYRSPNPYVQTAKAGIKLHWSTDQYTVGDYGRDIVPYVDQIVCISPFHLQYYARRYSGAMHKIGYIDLGVRIQDYQDVAAGKVTNRMIYCSVPERGLSVIAQIWPEIRKQIPDATLVITSDHRLWGSTSPNNHEYRLKLLGMEGIAFLGAIPRRELIKEQCKAQIHLFPCIYEELFCISAAECQVAAAYPVTSGFGSLPTTNLYGHVLDGNPRNGSWRQSYIDIVTELLQDQGKLAGLATDASVKAIERFRWERICDEWELLINEGKFAHVKRGKKAKQPASA